MNRPRFAGAFASCNPRTQVLAGMAALRAADPDGVALGRFGWADLSSGTVASERTASDQKLGFVIPVCSDWYKVYRSTVGEAWLRPGIEVTVCVRGDFWGFFPNGAIRGQPVYANPLDGTLISGYDPAGELTPWSVVTDVDAGGLAIITSWSTFTP